MCWVIGEIKIGLELLSRLNGESYGPSPGAYPLLVANTLIFTKYLYFRYSFSDCFNYGSIMH